MEDSNDLKTNEIFQEEIERINQRFELKHGVENFDVELTIKVGDKKYTAKCDGQQIEQLKRLAGISMLDELYSVTTNSIV